MNYSDSKKIGMYGEQNTESILRTFLIDDLYERYKKGAIDKAFFISRISHAPEATARQIVDRVDFDVVVTDIISQKSYMTSIDTKTDRYAYKTGNLYIEDKAIYEGCAMKILLIATEFEWNDDYTPPMDQAIVSECISANKSDIRKLIESHKHVYMHYDEFRNAYGEKRDSGYAVPRSDIRGLSSAHTCLLIDNVNVNSLDAAGGSICI